MTFISYAQNFEDVMLFRALRGIDRGSYIDIGAQDPIKHSVTKAFYERGWSGINVDPARHWIDRLSTERPHDVNLCVAASDHAGELKFYNIKDTGLSTTEADYARRHAEAGFEVTEEVVPCVTLDQICEQQSVDVVHFLKIDCEGAEESVLRGFSLQAVRPWIILVEATEPLSESPAYTSWEPLIVQRGYHFVYADGLNRFYVADEHGELDASFAHPPNVFDDYLRASEYELLLGQHAAQAARDQAGHWQRMSDFLQNENERREAALVDYRHRLDVQHNEHAGIVAGRDKLLAEQREELHHLQTGLELQQRQAADLARELQWQEENLAAAEQNLRMSQASQAVFERELAQVAAEKQRFEQELQQIHQTTSWRLTAPLRATKRLWIRAGGARGLARTAVAWPLRWCKPMLQKLVQNEQLRRPLVAALGRDSKLVNRARTFLFGQGLGHPAVVLPASLETAVTAMGWESQRALRELHPAQSDVVGSARNQ